MENNKIKAIFSRLYKDAEMKAAIKAPVTYGGRKAGSVKARPVVQSQADTLSDTDLEKVSGGLAKGTFKYA